jgi:hypothetical protein
MNNSLPAVKPDEYRPYCALAAANAAGATARGALAAVAARSADSSAANQNIQIV